MSVYLSVCLSIHEMLRLVEEYDQKPGLVPPLVVLEDLYKHVCLSIYPLNDKISGGVWPES